MSFLKFFVAVFLLFSWVISCHFGIIFYLTDYADVLALEKIKYHDGVFYHYDIKLAEESYTLLTLVIQIIALLTSAIISFSIVNHNSMRTELTVVIKEFRQVLQRVYQMVKQLSKTQKAVSLVFITLITLIRLFYLKQFPFTTDEVASFDFFVLEGALAVTSFYPTPNNHILSNLLSLFFSQFQTDPLLVMRIPTFVISLTGTLILYFVLIRYVGFAVATFGLSIFCCSQAGIFYAIAGRGYFLLIVLASLNFFSMLGIMYSSDKQKFYLFIFILTGILGFYAVPTFLYPFASTLLIGFSYFLFIKASSKISMLIISSCIVGMSSIILYLPVIFISGPYSLINHAYVQPLGSEIFWSKLPLYFLYTEGWLMGQERLGKYVLLGVVLLFAAKVIYFKERGLLLKFGLPALLMVFIPYVFMIFQQTFLPARASLYKSLYLYLIIGFLLFWLLNKVLSKSRFKEIIATMIMLFYGAYQLYHAEKQRLLVREKENQRREAFYTIINHKPRKPQNILVLNSAYALFLNHYLKASKLEGKIHSEKRTGEVYYFLIIDKNNNEDNLDLALHKEIYSNDYVQVYALKGEN